MGNSPTPQKRIIKPLDERSTPENCVIRPNTSSVNKPRTNNTNADFTKSNTTAHPNTECFSYSEDDFEEVYSTPNIQHKENSTRIADSTTVVQERPAIPTGNKYHWPTETELTDGSVFNETNCNKERILHIHNTTYNYSFQTTDQVTPSTVTDFNLESSSSQSANNSYEKNPKPENPIGKTKNNKTKKKTEMSANDFQRCVICKTYLRAPIRQCENYTHNYCEKCIENVRECIKCGGDILTERNKTLERLLEDAQYPCQYNDKGCKYFLTVCKKYEHEQECTNRSFSCEGKRFCKWNCNWKGDYDAIEQHFKNNHPKSATLGYKNDHLKIKLNVEKAIKELHLISAHYQLFWLKFRVDTEQKIVFWTVQFIGSKQAATYYFYELELFNESEPHRKYKISEYCESDVRDSNAMYKSRKCVAIPFETLESYKDSHGNISYRYWIHKIPKKTDSNASSQPGDVPNSIQPSESNTNSKQQSAKNDDQSRINKNYNRQRSKSRTKRNEQCSQNQTNPGPKQRQPQNYRNNPIPPPNESYRRPHDFPPPYSTEFARPAPSGHSSRHLRPTGMPPMNMPPMPPTRK